MSPAVPATRVSQVISVPTDDERWPLEEETTLETLSHKAPILYV